MLCHATRSDNCFIFYFNERKFLYPTRQSAYPSNFLPNVLNWTASDCNVPYENKFSIIAIVYFTKSVIAQKRHLFVFLYLRNVVPKSILFYTLLHRVKTCHYGYQDEHITDNFRVLIFRVEILQ